MELIQSEKTVADLEDRIATSSLLRHDGIIQAKELAITSLKSEVEALKSIITKQDSVIAALKKSLADEEDERRVYYEGYASLRGTVRVVVRIRPSTNLKPAEGHEKIWDATRSTLKIFASSRTSSVGQTSLTTGPSSEEAQRSFTFDRVFTPRDDNAAVFREMKSLVRTAVEGRSVVIFAYGASGTGKTYTMEAMQMSAAESLFRMLRRGSRTDEASTSLYAACTAVYRDQVQDLFCEGSTAKTLIVPRTKTLQGLPLNTSVVRIQSKEELEKQLSKAKSKSVYTATKLNSESSRGHTLFTIIISPPSEMVVMSSVASSSLLTYTELLKVDPTGPHFGYLTFVDLAGNESVKESGVQGDAFNEARSINASLSSLKTVLTALNQGKKPNWKENTLTMLLGGLMEVGGGEGRPDVLMLATLDLSEESVITKNIRTLEFAQMVRL